MYECNVRWRTNENNQPFDIDIEKKHNCENSEKDNAVCGWVDVRVVLQQFELKGGEWITE